MGQLRRRDASGLRVPDVRKLPCKFWHMVMHPWQCLQLCARRRGGRPAEMVVRCPPPIGSLSDRLTTLRRARMIHLPPHALRHSGAGVASGDARSRLLCSANGQR